METNKKMLLEEHEKPATGLWMLLSFQHVFAMFGATILVPLMTGLPVSVTLFSTGAGTLIYIICTKGKVPMFLGSSFAYVTFISTAFAISDNWGAAMTAIIFAGIIYIVVAIIIKFLGTSWLDKLLPPIIIGPMVMVIGLSLASFAVSLTGMDGNGDWMTIAVALVTTLVVAFTSIKGKGFLKIVPFLLGIIAGFTLALILNAIFDTDLFYYNGTDELANFLEVLKNPSQWVRLPQFVILGWANKDLGAGVSMVQVHFGAVLAVIPLAFATLAEHLGDVQVVGKITGKNYYKDPGLSRTILGDGLAQVTAGMIGGAANTSYGENISVIGMTRVASVWVTGAAAVIAIILSFLNVFSALIIAIPDPVLGGLCLILYGFIASNGIKVLIDSKVDITDTRNLIIASVMLVLGLGGAVLQLGSQAALNRAGLAMITGFILNAILPYEKKSETNIQEKPKSKEK